MTAGRARRIREPGPSWDLDDLTRRLDNALGIAARAVRLLAATGYQDPNEPASAVGPEKIVCETALFLLACAPLRATHARVRERVEEVAGLLLPHARNDRVTAGLCMDPGAALDHAFAHICLDRLGFRDPRLDRLLELSLNSEVADGRERLPHRMLEVEWLRGVRRAEARGDRGDGGWAARSMLARPIDVFAATRADVYAFTHALMYVTDLGTRAVRLPRRRAEVLAFAEASVARCLDQEDYDLCGELLLTWPYLGERWSPAASFAFHVLALVEDKVGFLPAPLTRPERYHELEGETRSRYAVATAYHTAYVMGLLCAAALRPGQAPPARLPTARRDADSSAVLALIEADARRAHWRDQLAALGRRERNALAPMLLTIALRRAVDRRDLAAVRALLEHGLRYGLVNVPACRQAAALLRRLAATATSG